MAEILCYGDSNTWGYDADGRGPGRMGRLPRGRRWPGVAQGILGEQFRILEDGLVGRTVVSRDPVFPHRHGLTGLRLALESHTPLDLVVLLLGTNELQTPYGMTPEAIARGMGRLIDACRGACCQYPVPQVLLMAPPPVLPRAYTLTFSPVMDSSTREKSLALGPLYRVLAEEKSCGFLDCGGLDLWLNETDGVHFCPEDHRKVGEAAAAAIRRMLEQHEI